MKHTHSHRPGAHRFGLCPLAARFILIGEFLLFAALFDFAARLNVAALAGSAGAIHRLSDIGGTLSASFVLLWAIGLGFDYWERQEQARHSDR